MNLKLSPFIRAMPVTVLCSSSSTQKTSNFANIAIALHSYIQALSVARTSRKHLATDYLQISPDPDMSTEVTLTVFIKSVLLYQK